MEQLNKLWFGIDTKKTKESIIVLYNYVHESHNDEQKQIIYYIIFIYIKMVKTNLYDRSENSSYLQILCWCGQ